MTPNDLVDVETVSFSPRTLALERIVSNEVMEHERLLQHEAHRLSVRARIWEAVHREVVVRHPSTWWDAVKLRFAPKWWLRRWPVRMTEVTVKAAEFLQGKMLDDAESTLAIRHDVLRYEWPEVG